ncbi:outer membrane protein TOM13-domain-containing protein [Sporodiniella umbellata]|nr:outer membrane protein TOM13-domain-containing protein [Sporodiniella umbellata]
MSNFNKSNSSLIQREPWYRHPTLLWLLKSTAINLVLPLLNGVMLGFGEILANELIFKYGWFGRSFHQLGLNNSVPPNATFEYRKAVNSAIKKEQQQQKDLLKLD